MKQKCPVCCMRVRLDSLSLVYLGVNFSFCSEQCMERFKGNPHLYIGIPGEKSIKQKGERVLKSRYFRIEQSLSTEQVKILSDAIDSMMGIHQVYIQGKDVHITYDLIEATAAQIEQIIINAGAKLGDGWTDKLKRALVHYTEDCETSNLEVSNKGHLNHH